MKLIAITLILLTSIFFGCSDDNSNPASNSDDTENISDNETPDTEKPDEENSNDEEKDDPNDQEDDNTDTDKPDEPVTGEGFIIFDNFENDVTLSGDGETNKDGQTDLGASFNYFNDETDKFYDGGYWYAYNESEDGGTSSAEPDYITDNKFEEGLSEDGYEGSALHIKITHNEGVKYPFYGIGANIREDGEYFDLSKMSAISFYAKGEGDMKVVFKTKEATEIFSGDWGDYDGPFTLSQDWTKVTIDASDIRASASSTLADEGEGFADGANKAVSKIHFQTRDAKVGDVVDFHIDNIVLEGFNSYDELKLAE